jgi:hypothetical protein
MKSSKIINYSTQSADPDPGLRYKFPERAQPKQHMAEHTTSREATSRTRRPHIYQNSK